jgi:type IV secretory pathway VirB10-like protein
MMPLARYFVFVGGALMALLFAFDLFSPKASADIGTQSASTGIVDKATLRIRSDQKWPERIVFDTTQPTVVAKAAQAQAASAVQAELPGPAPAPEITPTARVRETFAQFVPVEPRKPEATAKKRKVAKSPGQPMRVARSGFFGTSTW